MSESTCIEHERADCGICRENDRKLSIYSAKRAFLEGFARGADPDRARKRHVVESATHAHFMAGHRAGVEASASALEEYVRQEGLR